MKCRIRRVTCALLVIALFGVGQFASAQETGSIVGWGRQVVVPQSALSDLTAIAAGGSHSLGLKTDGSIVAWGHNYNGQCNLPEPNANFVGISAGESHSLGLKSGGSVVAWGSNNLGQCNVPAPNSNFIAVAAGFGHSLGLKSDGSIVAWGFNGMGQCNVPAPNSDFIAVAGGPYQSLGLKADGSIVAWGCGAPYNFGQCNVPSPDSDFVAVAAGGFHSLGLKSDGSVVAWGCGDPNYDFGQCNVPSPNTGFGAVAAGGYHSLGLKADGSIVAWGDNAGGQCNVPAPNTDFVAIAGFSHNLALKADGSIVVWGANFSAQCNVPAPNTDFVAVGAGSSHSLGLKADGSIVAWGSNNYGQCNVPAPNTDFVGVVAGGSHSLGLKANGSIVAWGAGPGDPPSPNTGFVVVAAGSGHSVGLKSDGSIVAWGSNSYGQCNVPAPNADFVAVAAGSGHSLGLKAGGSIVAWGSNASAQCNVPEPNTDFTAVAAGYSHSLGLKVDGSIVAWGWNYNGQCNVPAPNTDFVGIAASERHSLGLKADGSITAWGSNAYGQCNVPGPNADFVGVAAGESHSLGLKALSEFAGELVVDSVTLLGTGVAGRPLHVAWDVLNVDPEYSVHYSFYDVVYLSEDTLWDIDDIRSALILHEGPIPPLGGYHAEADVPLPGATPGPYYILVRTDHTDPPEGHTGAAEIFLDVEELTLDIPAVNEFTEIERARYYRVTAVGGAVLQISLDDLDNAGLNELYIKREAVPTRSQFDYRYAANFAPDQTIRIPGTAAATYYILAYAYWIPPGVQDSFTVLAQYVPLGLTDVTPNQGGNVGRLTAKLSGAGFTPNTLARLIDSQGGTHEASEVYFEDSLTIYPTFNLTDLIPGVCDVQVEDGTVRTLPSAFTVMDGGGAAFEARIVAPPAVRGFGSPFTFYVEYENQGNVDMPAPLLLLETDKPFWLDGHPDAQSTTLQFMAINYAGPAGILNPGTLHQVRFYSTAPAHMDLRSVTTSDVPIDWGSMYAERRPPFIDEAYWEEHWQEILSQVGNTWVEYVSSLAGRATVLTHENGYPCYLVEDLYLSLVEDASGGPVAESPELEASGGVGFAPPVVTYDRNAAKNYALYYMDKVCDDGRYYWPDLDAQAGAGKPLSQYLANPPSGQTGTGADCAHFVSRCIYHGGLVQDETNVGGLQSYLFPTYAEKVSQSLALHGDVIFSTVYSHAMFCLADGGVEIAEHSSSVPPSYGHRTLTSGNYECYHIKNTTNEDDTDDTGNTTAIDPNDKLSLQGWGESGFVQEDQLMRYGVYFENLPEATAATLTVQVTDQLGTELDWTTLTLDEIAFGGTVIRVPEGLSHYEGRVEFDGWTWNVADGWERYTEGTPLVPLVVDIEAGVNPETGEVHWLMRCADKNTGNYPTDVYAGFLPPDQGEIAYPDPENPDLMIHPGEGYLTYSVQLKPGLATGTQVRNRASIVFDTNDPIDTPETLNTIDSGPPTSSVTELPAHTTEGLFAVTWTGQDDAGGSGIAEYRVYVSDDGEPFRLWRTTGENTAEFLGLVGHTYAFYSVAKDNVGNVEPIPSEPDAVTVVHSAEAPMPDPIAKNRYLSFTPTNNGKETALRVTLADMPPPFESSEGCQLWVGAPYDVSEVAGKDDATPPTFKAASLQGEAYCMDWGTIALVSVFDNEIVPGAVYRVQAIDCSYDLGVEVNYSVPASLIASKWGDMVGGNNNLPPNGVVDFVDISAVVDKFKNAPGAPIKARADVAPDVPDKIIDFQDIPAVVDAFKGRPYPYGGPTECP